MVTKRYTSALRNSFQEKPLELEAVRVNGATVAIGGHFYPGYIGTDTAKVVNKGRPAAARYEAYGPQPAIGDAAGGGSSTSASVGGAALSASSIQALVQQYLLEHTSQHYIAAHNHTDPPDRTFYGTDWGIFGGSDVDESDKIIQMLEDVGPNATIFIAAQNAADPVIKVSKPISIYSDNVHFKSEQGTLWRYGAKGGVRIMGEIAQYSPFESGFAMKLRANSYENASGELVLPFVAGQVEDADLAVGMKLVIRGRNDASGKAIEKQVTYIKSIDGDDVTCVDDAAYTFQPTYDDSDWPPDATTGTTIYPVIFQLFTANRSRGDMTATVASIDGFAVGDLVEIGTNETEWDVNNGAISGTPPYPNGRKYLNPARKEQATISKITGSGPYTITFSRSFSHDYATARYAGITKLLPVRNSRISGLRCEYYEDQVNRSVHPLSIVFGYNCHVFDCHVDGRGGQKGQGCRIAYSYNCSVYNSTFIDPKFVGSGDGYGPSLYYSTRCRVSDNYISGCRHSVLLQLAVDCAIYDNQSDDDYISAYDAHGVNSRDCVFANNQARRSSNNSPDSSDCSGFRIGNTSHCAGDHYITVIANTISGYVHTNSAAMDTLAASSNITFIGNNVDGAQIGFKFKRNPNWITPVQTATNIQVIGNRFSNCTKAIEVICNPTFDNSNATGKILGLLIKNNISDGCTRHWDIEGRLGITNVRVVGNEIWNSIPTSGMYAVDVDECLGTVEVAYNVCCGANRGIRIQDTENAVVAFNILSGTVDSIALTTAGTTTGLNADLNIPYSGGGGGGGGDPLAEFTAKGQLMVGTGSGTGALLSVGANGTILVADSAQSSGVKWVPPLNDATGITLSYDGTNVKAVLNDGAVVEAKLGTGAVTETKIANSAVTLAKIADMAEARLLGRTVSAGTGVPQALPADHIWAITKTAATFTADVVAAVGSGSWPQKISDPGTNADPAASTAGAYVYYDNDLRYDGGAGDGVFVIESKSSAGNARDIRMIGRNIAFANATNNVFRINASNELDMASSSYPIRAGIVRARANGDLHLWAGNVDKGIKIDYESPSSYNIIVDLPTEFQQGVSISSGGLAVQNDIVFNGQILQHPVGTTGLDTSGGRVKVRIGSLFGAAMALTYASGSTIFQELGLESTTTGVQVGSTTDGNVLIYRNNTTKITVGSSGVTFADAITAPSASLAPSSTSVNGLIVNMPTSTTAAGLTVQYNGSTRLQHLAQSNQNALVLSAYDNGSSVGCQLQLNRNNNSSTPAAGFMIMFDKGGQGYRIWPDDSGDMRIWTGNPNNANDTSGTVIGTQTSHAKFKRILGEPVSDAEALDYLIEAAAQVKEFEYLSGSYGGESFSGLILDGPTKHRYGMDAHPDYPAGRALNYANGFGDTTKAFREIERRLRALEARWN